MQPGGGGGDGGKEGGGGGRRVYLYISLLNTVCECVSLPSMTSLC